MIFSLNTLGSIVPKHQTIRKNRIDYCTRAREGIREGGIEVTPLGMLSRRGCSAELYWNLGIITGQSGNFDLIVV